MRIKRSNICEPDEERVLEHLLAQFNKEMRRVRRSLSRNLAKTNRILTELRAKRNHMPAVQRRRKPKKLRF
jgi:hypothetical protein